jgi:CubicO group peptidase (beta-lactamase class C family)
MKQLLFFLMLFVFASETKAQSLYFPPITGNNWDTMQPTTLGWCEEKIDTLLHYLESKNTKSFIVLKDGKIVIEKYFGTFTQDSLWYWASAGKTLTAFMVGIAQQENYLSINDTTSKYLGQGWTNCTPSQEEKITISNQLTMTTGLDDGVPENACTFDTCLIYKADAGTRWAYHNAPYTLLDEVIASATGQTLNAYTNQKLKIPTGITGTFATSGYNNVFFSKARSMARFALLILNKGNWNGNPIMTDTTYFNQMVNTSQSLNNAYGFLWWLNGKSSIMVPGSQVIFPTTMCPSAPSDMIAALGLNGQIINVVPSQNLVYIRMGNAPGVGEVPIFFNDTIWQKINDLTCVITTTKEDELAQQDDLKIFPNPSSNNTTITLNNQAFDLCIIDMTGRIVFKKENCFASEKVDVQLFQNGIYHVKITTTDSKVFSKRLVVFQ